MCKHIFTFLLLLFILFLSSLQTPWVDTMVYQNHGLKMLIQWKATDFHPNQSSPLKKQLSPLHQVLVGDGESFFEFES
jgi:hypothetical protein